MKKRIIYQPLYFVFWLLYFIVARAIFLLYHAEKTKRLSGEEVLLTFLNGLHLDASFTAYICVLPFLAIVIKEATRTIKVNGFIKYYTYTLLVLLSILLAADLELYRFWGYRLDTSPLQYLSTPAEMAASVAAAPFFLLFGITATVAGGFIILYKLWVDYFRFHHKFSRLLFSSVALLYLAVLVLPMRGGIQQIPINQSVAYFSDTPFANHAGLNMPWNLMHALIKYDKGKENPYQFMSPEEAEQLVKELHHVAVADSAERFVSQKRPNVVFIILESFTAKFSESLGGEKGVTPNLDQLAAEGISFTNIYSSGDRSEKGMVALLSGYPVQTITSIIKTPKKTEKLPQLSHVFEQNGYGTSFYYGGELEFANIKSYLRNGGYNKLIDKADFPESSYNSKWGAHDHVLFDKVLQELNQEKEPFFSTVYTLSSHEPFEIPIPAKFKGNDVATKFRNSVYYTDWALGKFITEAKKQPWWQNTLVVLVADHGHPLPTDDENHQPSKFRIPFILTGGALDKKGMAINTVGDQTSVAPTLLYQVGLPYNSFSWGRNLVAPSSYPFAFYVFNDGFGFVTQEGIVTYDNVSRKAITKDKGVSQQQLTLGKAYMQYSFEDFVKK